MQAPALVRQAVSLPGEATRVRGPTLQVEELTVEYESGLCSFLAGAAGGNT